MDATLDGRGGKMKEKLKSTFSDSLGLSDDVIERRCICLYHGIRFDAINRLESIFQTGYIIRIMLLKDGYMLLQDIIMTMILILNLFILL